MIIAGFGFRRDATTASLRDALDRARAGRTVAAFATAEDKAPALQPLADFLSLPVHALPPEALAQPTLTRSERVMAERGTGSLAEAAALAAAGPGGRLLGQRSLSSDRMAACALAEKGTP